MILNILKLKNIDGLQKHTFIKLPQFNSYPKGFDTIDAQNFFLSNQRIELIKEISTQDKKSYN